MYTHSIVIIIFIIIVRVCSCSNVKVRVENTATLILDHLRFIPYIAGLKYLKSGSIMGSRAVMCG